MRPSVTAIVVAHNGGQALLDCLASLQQQDLAGLEVLVIDNASVDGSIERAEELFTGLRVVRQGRNGGYAAGANAGCRLATAEAVVVLNQDLVLMPDCLAQLRDVLLEADGPALVSPKLLLRSNPERVNAIGNDVHVSGVAWCHGLGTLAHAWHGTVEVTAISGAAFMARASFLQELGGLEEGYFLYLEDVDLSLRARLAGGRCLVACDAVATHDWRLSLPPERFRLMERNRRALFRRFFTVTPRTYPVLVQAELMGWTYALVRGPKHVRAKWRAERHPLRLSPVADELNMLVRSLAREHPYRVLFPRARIVERVGRIADQLFTSLLPRLAESRVQAPAPMRDASENGDDLR